MEMKAKPKSIIDNHTFQGSQNKMGQDKIKVQVLKADKTSKGCKNLDKKVLRSIGGFNVIIR